MSRHRYAMRASFRENRGQFSPRWKRVGAVQRRLIVCSLASPVTRNNALSRRVMKTVLSSGGDATGFRIKTDPTANWSHSGHDHPVTVRIAARSANAAVCWSCQLRSRRMAFLVACEESARDEHADQDEGDDCGNESKSGARSHRMRFRGETETMTESRQFFSRRPQARSSPLSPRAERCQRDSPKWIARCS